MTQILEAALHLTKVMNKVADTALPEKLVGIVKLHAGLAVGSAFIPVPGADLAASAANIWTMYIRINKELDLPFSENLVKSIAAGVATNLGGAAAGFLVAGTAAKFLPGLGSAGGAVLMAATIFAITIVAGIVYMRALAAAHSLQGSGAISEDALRKAADAAMRDKDALKELIKQSRSEYKPD
jgi:uncharacterized protein (DUF697 family)